jgi:hypothetical protein
MMVRLDTGEPDTRELKMSSNHVRERHRRHAMLTGSIKRWRRRSVALDSGQQDCAGLALTARHNSILLSGDAFADVDHRRLRVRPCAGS